MRSFVQDGTAGPGVPSDRALPGKCLKLVGRLALAVAAAAQLTACANVVQWEEEVPLNTGETIWVNRTVVYSERGGAGNPLDVRSRPDRDEAIEFTWNGKQYAYKGDARILLLAISPQRQPVLVAKAGDNSWRARHHYPCTIPYYVQLVPDATGREWSWPPKIETWLYNLPKNLLLQRHPPDQMKSRYSAQERNAEDAVGSVKDPAQRTIDPTYTGDHCAKRRPG